MQRIYEYHTFCEVKDADLLKEFLYSVWQEKYKTFIEEDDEMFDEEIDVYYRREYQPFLTFDGFSVRARNFIGFIQTKDDHIEIFPKVFKNSFASPALMMRHLFFWFDYCSKWKFPFSKSNLDSLENLDFPELIIYLMSSKMFDTVSTQPLSLYQNVEESLYTPKGRVNFERYLSSGFINGNQHLLECDHTPFVFDNNFNQIVKFAARLLLDRTRFSESSNLLQELIYILDEVTDRHCSSDELKQIQLNPFFSDYLDIKDICQIVIEQLLYSNEKFDLSQWNMLFPMEYIFEDFIAGFIKSKFSNEWKVEFQKSEMNLVSNPQVFQMRHDIFLTNKNDNSIKIIIDTKYKLRDGNFKGDKKKGVDQGDLYQMLSYAVRRGCSNVLLLYPNIDSNHNDPDSFIIESGFNGNDKVNITIAEVPIWTLEEFEILATKLEDTLKKLLKKYA